jgi:predicted AlkP superfamily pyrophosphatase or phosphodiesterase
MIRNPHLILFSVVAVIVAGRGLFSQSSSPPTRPTLLVLLVVDQMRADYVDRFRASWTGGLHRLVTEGAFFSNAAYPYFHTWTCAGHATISTGTNPAVHGIIQNAWWDRELRRNVTCTDDPSMPLVSYGAPTRTGASLKRLQASTLADELRLGSPDSKIVALSLKERSAMMLAGRRPDMATWFDDGANSWVTSSAYSKHPVPFVATFLQKDPIERSLGDTWTKRLDPASYPGPDDGIGEKPPRGWATSFPHPFDDGSHTTDNVFYDRWQESPASDAYIERMSEAAIDALQLGRGPATDYLALSFSALDLVGHDFGPDSHEVQDVLAHLDVTLERLFTFLDSRVGRGRYVVALSADHGVASVPERAVAAGLDAGRILTTPLIRSVEQALEPIMGTGPHVARMVFTDLYFEPERAAAILANPAAMKAVRDALLTAPGVQHVVSQTELSQSSNDPVVQAIKLSYVPGRNGDLVVVPKSGWVFNTALPIPAANHGTLYPYDQRVPVILMGTRIGPGTYPQAATPADIAPTLATLSGLKMDRAQSRVLNEAVIAR